MSILGGAVSRWKGTHVDPTTPANAQPVGKSAGWELTMSEEFNDGMTVVDADNGLLRFHPNGPLWRAWLANYHTHVKAHRLAQKENFRTGNPSLPEHQVYDIEGNSVSGGCLTQTARLSSKWDGFVYTSGCVSSHPGHSQKYGYFETSIRAQSGPMTWPAFWMLPQEWQYSSAGSPITYEFDILELFNNSSSSNNHSPGTAMNNQSLPVPSTTNTEFHTYGLEWTRDRLQVYYDGVPKGWDTSGLIHIPMFVIVNLACAVWNNNYTFPPEISIDIDYIRTWRAS